MYGKVCSEMAASLSSYNESHAAMLQDTLKDHRILQQLILTLALVTSVIAWLTIEQRVERVLKDRLLYDSKKFDKLVQTLPQSLAASLSAKVDKTVKNEITRTIVPGGCG